MRGTVAKMLKSWAKQEAVDLSNWGTLYMDITGTSLRVSPAKRSYKVWKEIWRNSNHEAKAKAKALLN